MLVTALGDYALDPGLEPHYATWASMAEAGGGFLSSAMAHSLDLAQYIFGRIEPDAVLKQNALPVSRRSPGTSFMTTRSARTLPLPVSLR